MELHGIDVSKWQGVIDYSTTAKNIDFAIIKAGGSDNGLYCDKYFEKNYRGFKNAGVPIGAYFFAGRDFITNEIAERDALYLLSLLKGKSFEYPIILDIEFQPAVYKNQITDATITFCRIIEKAGGYAMIYASDVSGFSERLEKTRLTYFDKWVARYGKEPATPCGMWQYSDVGQIAGINRYVDLDVAFKNYPAIMKKKNLNKF